MTARKEAEEQLRASELVQSATVEHLPAIVYREPPDGPLSGTLYVSPQVREMLGYTPEEWTTSEVDFWAEHIHPDDAPSVLAANKHANATKEPFGAEYRIQHADSSYRWVHDEATFVPDVAGGWWQGFMIDISERRAAEDQLREAEERFRLIVERGPAIFYQQEFDPEDPDVSRTTYVSPQQGLLFGYSDEELLADPTLWASTIHPDDRDRVLSADVESNRNVDEHFSMEYRMISKDGRILWVQDTCSLGEGPREAAVLAGVHPRHHRAQAGRGTARPRPGGRARGEPAAACPRRDEEHVPAGRVARPTDAAGRDPRTRDHAGTWRRPPRGGRREGYWLGGSRATPGAWTGSSRTCSTWTGSRAGS